MTNIIINTDLENNLKEVCCYNEKTKLCLYEPTLKLYIIKAVPLSAKEGYLAIQSLSNSHLAKINDVLEKTDHLEVIREYISGDVLADLLDKQQYLTPAMAITIIADICDGLSAMHKAGYVHRDINPNNIIVSSFGRAMIIDFGIARSFSTEKSNDTTILGTYGYAAPEQFGFSQSDARTDIYAVGVLLNVMLTGKLPNEKKAEGPLGKIISKCTEIDAARRYKDIEAVKAAVNDQIPGNSPMEKMIRQLPGLRSQNKLVVILAAIAYVVVIFFSITIFTSAKKGTYLLTALVWILEVPIPFFCFFNVCDIWNLIPFSKGASRNSQRIIYIIIGLVFYLTSVILYGLI